MTDIDESPSDRPRAIRPAWRRGLGLMGEAPPAMIGLAAFALGTVPEVAADWSAILTAVCLAVAAVYTARYAAQLASASSRLEWALSVPAIVDLLAILPVPLALASGAGPAPARLFGALWALKLLRLNPALAMLARVIRNERQSLASVTMAFAVVVLISATLVYLAERGAQPEAFGSVPAALWWAVTTITTTGYGDKVPASLVGRILAGGVMVSGIGLFALWAGILASGFAQELRRREFLESWDLVVRLPLFRDLGASALSDITRLLKVQHCPAGSAVVRRGQPGDSMYFIADGEAEVRTPTARIPLAPGQFFGEMALISGAPRSATVVAVTAMRLLRLDVVDFRELAARLPELLEVIEAEGARRGAAVPA